MVSKAKKNAGIFWLKRVLKIYGVFLGKHDTPGDGVIVTDVVIVVDVSVVVSVIVVDVVK